MTTEGGRRYERDVVKVLCCDHRDSLKGQWNSEPGYNIMSETREERWSKYS